MTTNYQRAFRARQVVREYQRINNSEPDATIYNETVTDLLADLMHFCKEQDLDFDASFNMASIHFESER